MAIVIGQSLLTGVGLPRADVERWLAAEPSIFPGAQDATRATLDVEARSLSEFLLAGEALLRRLPPRAKRSEAEQAAASELHAALRSVRGRFLRSYAALVYEDLTDDLSRAVRVEDLVYEAAERYPGLVPSRAQVQAERQ